MREADVAGLELERVLPKVRTVFERDDKFYSQIEKRPAEKVSNRSMRIPLELRPGGSFQYFNPDGGDLGRGSGPYFDKAIVNCVFMSENMEYTKLAQWSTDDERKAVINSIRRLTATTLDELRRQLDAQLMQAGNGVLGTITTSTPAAGVDTYTLTTDGFGARLMRYNQTVQVYDSTLATLRGSGLITMHDTVNKTVAVTPSIAGSTTGDLIVVNGISSPTTLPALLGVPYHHSNASTGTWLGFNRANFPEIRSNRVNGGGVALTLPLARLAMNRMGSRVGIDDSMRPEAWMNPAQLAAYEEIGQLMLTATMGSNKDTFDPYYTKFQLAGAPVKTSFNWDATRIDFIQKDVWGRAEILPIGFYKTDGRNIFEIRGASGGVATADIFYMVVGMQTFVTNPAATAYIDNLAVPTGY